MLNLPAGYFGIVLGTIGMGFAAMPAVWQVGHWLGDGLVILAMIIWGLLTGAFVPDSYAFRIACWRKFAIQC